MEIRSNQPGLLSAFSLEWETAPSRGEAAAVLSVVADDANRAGAKPRRLPTLYWESTAIFAARDLAAVEESLRLTLTGIRRSIERPTYFVHPCRLGRRYGIYVRDSFNRSVYRLRLKRGGMEFSSDAFPRFLEDGSFESDDWGRFEPDFAVFAYDPDEPSEVGRSKGALVPFTLAQFRLGDLTGPEEFRRLTDLCRRIDAVSAGDARALVAALRTS